ncbi:MAG: OmpA family protein [Kiloniellales bacterium]|nr:OmpA family protein [Kiloniellales bacterium]
MPRLPYRSCSNVGAFTFPVAKGPDGWTIFAAATFCLTLISMSPVVNARDASPSTILIFEEVLENLPAEGAVPALPYRRGDQVPGQGAETSTTTLLPIADGKDASTEMTPTSSQPISSATGSDLPTGEESAEKSTSAPEKVEDAPGPVVPAAPSAANGQDPEPPVQVAVGVPSVPEAPSLDDKPAVVEPVEAAVSGNSGAPVEGEPKPENGETPLVLENSEALASILFEPGSAELRSESASTLENVAGMMKADGDLRIQLLAYAAKDEESPNAARRISLSRALAVRRFLNEQGISSTRMQLRALGDKVPEGAADRVDIRPRGG